jgi:hypothetical protein
MIQYADVVQVPNHVKLGRTVKKELLYKLASMFTQKELETIIADRETKADPLKHWRGIEPQPWPLGEPMVKR